MEWTGDTPGTPPPGMYLFDDGREQHRVYVGYGRFDLNGVAYAIDYAYDNGKLLGPIRRKETDDMNAEKQGDTNANGNEAKRRSRQPGTEVLQSAPVLAAAQPAADLPSDIDAKTDAKIREALSELAEHPFVRPDLELVDRVAKFYGDEIKKARKEGRGWRAIAGVFKRHGVRIGYKALRSRAEG
jgi:hypothetical protein